MTDTELKHEFELHATAWEMGTRHLSNSSQALRHPSGQAVLGLGVAAVPLIFARLERRANPFWMTMLWTILQDGPAIPEQDHGRVTRMAEYWLAWGRERGYLPEHK